MYENDNLFFIQEPAETTATKSIKAKGYIYKNYIMAGAAGVSQ